MHPGVQWPERMKLRSESRKTAATDLHCPLRVMNMNEILPPRTLKHSFLQCLRSWQTNKNITVVWAGQQIPQIVVPYLGHLTQEIPCPGPKAALCLALRLVLMLDKKSQWKLQPKCVNTQVWIAVSFACWSQSFSKTQLLSDEDTWGPPYEHDIHSPETVASTIRCTMSSLLLGLCFKFTEVIDYYIYNVILWNKPFIASGSNASTISLAWCSHLLCCKLSQTGKMKRGTALIKCTLPRTTSEMQNNNVLKTGFHGQQCLAFSSCYSVLCM